MINKYLIRFNTKHNGSDLVWRIFENGVEYLASDIRINGSVFTESSVENGENKWNIACIGKLSWNETVAVINA